MAVLFEKLGLFDVYHSFWLLIPAGLLTLNLIACTWIGIPIYLKRMHETRYGEEKKYPYETGFELSGVPEEIAARLEKFLERRFLRVNWKDVPGGKVLLLRKNAFSILGVPIVHLSTLIMIAGALAGAISGFEGHMSVAEGESSRSVILKGTGLEKTLDFEVHCRRFSVSYYENGMPEEYRSDLDFMKNGQVAARTVLRVNEPASFEGIRFYQESFGKTPVKIMLDLDDGRGQKNEIRVSGAEVFRLPGSDAVARITRVEEDLMGFGPGVKVRVDSSLGTVEFWVFENIEKIRTENPGVLEKAPLFDPARFKPYRFSLKELKTKSYTGMIVSRDPGVPLVFTGFLGIVSGLVIIFFFPYYQMRVILKSENRRVIVGIVGIEPRPGRTGTENRKDPGKTRA